MPILITPVSGRGKFVNVTTKTNHKINSEEILRFELLEDKYNYDVVRAIGKRWRVSRVDGPDDKKEYLAFIIDRRTHGDKQRVTVSCRYKPIDIIKGNRVYGTINGSFKPEKILDIALKDTGIDFKVTETLPSSQFENAGEGETSEELIKKVKDHWDLDFDIEYDSEKDKYTFVFMPYLQKYANYHIDEEINANDVKVEEDSGELATFGMAYGDYTEEQGITGAGLVIKFEHPDMKDIGKYHVDPIKDGRIKDEELLKAKLERKINESVKRSISLNFIALKKHYPNAIPKVGDIVKMRHAILGINEFVRIVEVETVRDVNNEIVSQDVTLGEFKRYDRYMRRISVAANAISGLGGGTFTSDYRTTSAKASSVMATTQRKMAEENNATNEKAGLMSPEDKKKLDTLELLKLVAKKEDGTELDLTKQEFFIDSEGNLKIKEAGPNA